MISIYKRQELNEQKSLDNYMYYRKYFSDEEIDKIFEITKDEKFQSGIAGGVVNQSYRRSNVKWIPYNKETKWIYDKLTVIVKSSNRDMWNFDLVGFGEEIQIGEYRDDELGFYDWHLDVGENSDYRKLSISVQLTDPDTYEGGELYFKTGKNERKADSGKGTVVIFPSYFLHKVTPVTKGIRHSLVVWITGPPLR